MGAKNGFKSPFNPHTHHEIEPDSNACKLEFTRPPDRARRIYQSDPGEEHVGVLRDHRVLVWPQQVEVPELIVQVGLGLEGLIAKRRRSRYGSESYDPPRTG
jgi:hypothetical protein